MATLFEPTAHLHVETDWYELGSFSCTKAEGTIRYSEEVIFTGSPPDWPQKLTTALGLAADVAASIRPVVADHGQAPKDLTDWSDDRIIAACIRDIDDEDGPFSGLVEDIILEMQDRIEATYPGVLRGDDDTLVAYVDLMGTDLPEAPLQLRQRATGWQPLLDELTSASGGHGDDHVH